MPGRKSRQRNESVVGAQGIYESMQVDDGVLTAALQL